MTAKTISAAIILSCMFFGGLMGYHLFKDSSITLAFVAAGLVVGLFSVALVRTWLKTEAEKIVGGAVGLVVGGLLAVLVLSGLSGVIKKPEIASTLQMAVTVLFCLIGLHLGASKAQEFRRLIHGETGQEPRSAAILDTSVIIDGRVADVCETGFLHGDLIIPRFVLEELQMIADSSDSNKRTRGRRGLDILNRIKKQAYVEIIIDDTDYPSLKEVDQKLIQMAREKGHAILTNDFNLNKVAEVHSLQVLNINRLANALKPIVLPGETMKVQIIKEGKETGQGVAYLDDGTMVVVDNGRKYMGKTLEVSVSSVLQTTAGRMIFALIKG